jgi:acyl-CoA synthetase (AMP-forming)/AMP-acid ligase II
MSSPSASGAATAGGSPLDSGSDKAAALAWDVNWSTIWDRVAAAVPDDVAVIEGDASVTYRELEDRSARLARAFADRGIGHGDVIGICHYNRLEYVEAVYAAFKLGAIPVNMNYRYRSRELADLIRISGARLVLAPASLRAEIAAAVDLTGTPVARIEIADADLEPDPASEEYESILGERYDGPDVRGGADLIYLFTGGTTGTPKVVVWRHGDLLDAQLVSIFTALGLPMPALVEDTWSHAGRLPVTPRTLPLAPLMHSSAMFNVMNTLVLGGTVVLLGAPRLDPHQALATIQRHGVTRLIIAGNAIALPLIEGMESASLAGAPYDASTVTSIISSGMAFTADRKAEIRQHMPAMIMDIFGATEGGPYAYAFVRSDADLPPRIELAVGGAVLDADGREVAPGGEGVLAYRGPMPLGYLDEPAKTAEVYRWIDGVRWVSPGDWVRVLDADGGIEFLGRDSSVVNTGGEKVYPAEVEEELLTHPQVSDAVVFGVPDLRWGQAVAAVVAVSPGAAVTAEELRDFVGERLAGYKKPKRIVVLDSLGRGPSGKADLPRLKELVQSAP